MMGAPYATKKVLKENIGKEFRFIETSFFGAEYHGEGTYTVVGADPFTNRKWYATVTVNAQLAPLLHASVTVQLTLFVPTVNVEPLGGVQTSVGLASHPSLTLNP